MSAAHTLTLINGWETVRYELLNTRICDLGLQIDGSRSYAEQSLKWVSWYVGWPLRIRARN